jgi:hypothetical protein
MLYVLRHGWQEKWQEVCDIHSQAWNDAIRGQTVDGRSLRVVVSLEEETRLLIITAIA